MSPRTRRDRGRPTLTDQEYGSRDFAARDRAGHLWSFGTYRPVIRG